MRHLLDTSALLAHFREEQGAAAVQSLLEQDEGEIFLSSLTLAEFARRLRALGATAEEAMADLAAYEEMADAVLPADAAVSRTAIALGEAASERLPLIDLLIAATARQAGATLVHRDNHFVAIPAAQLAQRNLAMPD